MLWIWIASLLHPWLALTQPSLPVWLGCATTVLVTGAGIGEMVLQMLVGLVSGVLSGWGSSGWGALLQVDEKIWPTAFKSKLSLPESHQAGAGCFHFRAGQTQKPGLQMWDVETLMTECTNPKQTRLSGPEARGPHENAVGLQSPDGVP